MMEFWATNWGDVATAAGIIISLAGLGWAVWEAHGAKSASRAAEFAAKETREQMARHLQAVELQRAIGLIERLKTLHDIGRWEASTEHYQTLREMLSDVIVRCPEEYRTVRENLSSARKVLLAVENLVRERGDRNMSSHDRTRLNRRINEIQSVLEELASNIGFDDTPGDIA